MASDIALSTTKALAAAPEAEDALLAQCRQGDAQAFTRLVARSVYRLISRMGVQAPKT